MTDAEIRAWERIKAASIMGERTGYDVDPEALEYYSFPITSGGTSLTGMCGQMITGHQVHAYHYAGVVAFASGHVQYIPIEKFRDGKAVLDCKIPSFWTAISTDETKKREVE